MKTALSILLLFVIWVLLFCTTINVDKVNKTITMLCNPRIFGGYEEIIMGASK